MVSISSCSVDLQEIPPNPGFGSATSFHSSEYTASGNTEDFIREVTERHNISCHVINSEDESSNPFSLSSSRHSLLIVDSDIDKDSASSPEMMDSPQEPKEPRISYSLSSCAINHSPPVSNRPTVVTNSEVDGSGALINLPLDKEDEVGSNFSSLKPPRILRQERLLEEDSMEMNHLIPNLSVDNDATPLSTTPTPQGDIKTDGEVSADVSTRFYNDEDLEELIDEIVCGDGSTPSIRVPIPTRRQSNCEPPSRGAPSLIPLYQRRISLTALSGFTPLPNITPITLLPPPEDTRKLSDPAVCLRKERVNSHLYMTKQKRCLSDSEAPNFTTDDDDCKSEECESSALDSGYHDSRFQDGSSINYPPSSQVSLSNFSDDFMEPPLPSPRKTRRPTPFSPFGPKPEALASMTWPWDEVGQAGSQTNSVPSNHQKRSVVSRQSQSSIATSSESVSISSFWESQMSQMSAVDILSSLGFDDYESPQLVPDRFVPKDVEHAKPSMMKSMPSFDEDDLDYPSRAPSISTMSESSVSSTQPTLRPLSKGTHDLPLGATAENFIAPSSPPPQPALTSPVERIPSNSNPPAPTSFMYRYNTILETVPEETASDLSPSPRWMSPRVSIDHSVVMDLVENKLGASLAQKARKRSLPTREGYKWSIGSQVDSETGDSIHVSVTSYDDELALEKEKEKEELSVPIPVEDATTGARRARRKGVYVPPASLLTWLNSQEPISEEVQNPEELPWPFSEQAKLRVSLSEIQMERQETDSKETKSPYSSVEPSPRLLVDEPVCNILDSSSRSASVEPHGRLSLSSIGSHDRSIGSHDLERSCSPDDRARTTENNLVPPSLKRRSRSLSPIVPPREEAIRRSRRTSQTTDDIQVNTPAASRVRKVSHDHLRVITHEDKDYKAVSQWLQSELDSLEAKATSIETTLREENDELERKLNTSGKMLTRQKTINHDLLQVQSIIK